MKDKSERVNRVPKARGEWVDLEPLEDAVLPVSPVPEAGDWHQRTKHLWHAWRADPVTSQYSEADKALIVELIINYDNWVKRKKGLSSDALFASLVRLMNQLGLTPSGKRDLRWRTPNEATTLKKIEEKSKSAEVRRIRAV